MREYRYKALEIDEPTVKYPPRGGWVVHRKAHVDGYDYDHAGYYSEQLRKCPVCGRHPVFEEDARYATGETEKARFFIGVCPTCSLRTSGDGLTLKEAVYQWQRREYTEDTWLICHRPKFFESGVRVLCDKIIGTVIDDALMYARRRQDVPKSSDEWKALGRLLDELEQFFRTSCFMYALDPDGIISDIRRALYPNMDPEKRIRIPLQLSRLYEGKAIKK